LSEQYSLIRDLTKLNRESWNRLAGSQPMLQLEFLQLLTQTQCACDQTGWAPHFLVLERNGVLVAAMPMYVKTHSRGEYVFDYAWARAFMQHGLEYYPKLLSAVPFTPVPGPRLLAENQEDRIKLAIAAQSIAEQNNLSSVHVLFPNDEDRDALLEAGYMLRETVQFHWLNQGYTSFEHFLESMNQKNRKKIRQDQKKVDNAGITFKWLSGNEISPAALSFFYQCYENTYYEHGNPPYLSFEFFQRLHEEIPDSIMLVLAERAGQPVACALNLKTPSRLYGRYWGSMEFIPGLHFETCYLQSIAYCIEKGIESFEGGAQGEHKLSRGLLPVKTWSAHWVGEPGFAKAIARFLDEETQAIDHYAQTLSAHSPFRKNT
jgi:predicted N-acyltransferase|tara:strand:- start:68368 stop:69495 length:1128 start_codon:yes stop_codon:yes gene_type:complete